MSLTASAVTTAAAVAAARPSWREEQRQDREARARIGRERDAARTANKITERGAAQRLRQEAAEARREARALAAADRAARRDALGDWVNRHVTDLLFVPVIGVPAVLAWTAMASYGAHLYGPPGRALPAFSEGAMWAFAAAVTITRHRHPDRPIWHLRAGTVVFALSGAVLNFAHGLTLAHVGGPVTGTVMALVSVAGVTAHQLTTAGPRRTRKARAERDAEHIARLAARRMRKARKQAVKDAAAELGTDGTVRLVFAETAAADTAAAPAEPTAPRSRKRPARADSATAHSTDTAATIARLRARHPDLSTADIAARLGISPRTVRRYPPATQTSA
jgi:DNA-binding CsgD family transcriptional regulator